MFQSSIKRLRTWLEWTDDILGDETEGILGAEDDARPHPHRQPLRWQPARRPGTVPPRPVCCISPVRSEPASRQAEPAGR